MCVAKVNNKCKLINRSQLGRAVRTALKSARMEKRLICGLLPAIAYLEQNADEVLICVLPQSIDSATHMQTVLLQAFCYENEIPVVQVDDGDKLANFCGLTQKKNSIECNCAIITRNLDIPVTSEELPLSTSEQYLTDFYECTLEEFPRPVIELPI